VRTLNRRRLLSLFSVPLVAMLGLAGCGAGPASAAATPATTASSPAQTLRATARAGTASAVASGTAQQTAAALTDAATADGTAAGSTATTAAVTALARATVSSSSSGPSATTRAALVTVTAYFTAGSRLVTETRQVAAAQPLQASLTALLAGPRTSGHYTQAPVGTRLLGVQLAGTHATINLSQEATAIEGSPAIPLFLAQLVDTATQFPTVRQVTLQVDGRPLTALGGEGVTVPEPLDRAAVQRMLAGT
jgi:spore germination protein GerM